jgi:hypothetical protein
MTAYLLTLWRWWLLIWTPIRNILSTEWLRNLITIIAVGVAAFSLMTQARLQKRTAAYQSWDKLAEVSIQNPDFAEANIKFVNGDTENERKYIWYMERLLIAGEQIMISESNSLQWKSALIPEIAKHSAYLFHVRFLGSRDRPRSVANSTYCTYVPAFREVIRAGLIESLSKGDDSKKTTFERALHRYEAQCIYED